MADVNIVDDQHTDDQHAEEPAEEVMSGDCDLMFSVPFFSEPNVFTIDPDGDLFLKVGMNKCLLNDGLSSRKRAMSGGDPSTKRKKASQGEDVSDNEESTQPEGQDNPSPGDEAASHTEDDIGSGTEDEVEFMEIEYEGYRSGEDDDFQSEDSTDESPNNDDQESSAGEDSDCEPDEYGLEHRHTGTITYMVDSRALARASPVWKKLLYGGYAESKPANALTASDWVVELPEDHPIAIETLLNIIHGNFGLSPTIDEDVLFEVTVLTNKYFLTRSLRPWACTWMDFIGKTFKKQCHNPDPDFQFDNLLWIAWELGAPKLFREVASLLTRHCAINDNGDLQFEMNDKTIELFTGIHNPPGMQENIRAVRKDLIEQLLHPYVALVHNLLDASSDKQRCKGGYSGPEHDTCQSLILGKVIRSLAQVKLWPIPEADDVLMSPFQLVETLDKVNTRNGSDRHRYCMGLEENGQRQNQAVLSKAYQPLEHHISHMNKQAQESELSHGAY
ncbi:hypothetical protein GGR57DRAFT_481649 [Xylariaceae sp. FL1272]|nr:hypothetical protein GGR57DRAFT_481649 [Xylariaceae sp. FL1272]